MDLSTNVVAIVIFKSREVLLRANMSPRASRGELTSSIISLVFMNHATDFAEKEGLPLCVRKLLIYLRHVTINDTCGSL